MAKKKRRLTANERDRIKAELTEVQRDVRALIDVLKAKIVEKRSN
jgi:hypothetical protein